MVSAGNRPSPKDQLKPTGAARTRRTGGTSNPWRALRHRNFRLFFVGQSVSMIGTWMTRIATSWLVYRLTHSALLLGTVSFSGQIPTFLLAPFAGVWVDRLNRQKVLVWTQVISAIQSFLLAGFTLTGRINIPWIIALSILQGLINAFDMPGRQSFVVQMIDDKADLGNAIAINSSMANTARLIGPSLAGLLIAATNEGWCFFIDGFSYIGVIASLLMMRITVPQIQRKHGSTFNDLKEGWAYVTGFVPIRVILSLFALVSLMGIPFVVLMPIFAARVLAGGPHTLGFLMGAVGMGAVTAALSLAARRSVRGLLRVIPGAAVVFGAGLIAFGLSHAFWTSLIAVYVAGLGMMAGMAGSNTVIQTLVSEDKRGRVMSYWTMAFVGMSPFGALLAGTMAHSIPPTPMWFSGGPLLDGSQWTVIINGSIVILGALWFYTKRRAVVAVVRPIYQEMGIIPTEEEMEAEMVAEQVESS
jgi:MFS family permease